MRSAWIAVIATLFGSLSVCFQTPSYSFVIAITKWAVAQWLPFPFLPVSNYLQESAWKDWDNLRQPAAVLEIPTIYVQKFSSPLALLKHLEETFGTQWRSKPLLLKGLWHEEYLQSNHSRRLSEAGLLGEPLTIPYFTDARVLGALTPDGRAPIQDIVANITKLGAPHKIGTQFLIQAYPELVEEVAPHDIVTTLFGDRFAPHHVVGAFGLPFLPALTTVPLFVAGSYSKDQSQTSGEEKDESLRRHKRPFTGLHCEPIGNVAVQLSGEKQWLLISPEHSFMVKPSASPDGRPFFASGLSSEDEFSRIPRYHATTSAGDAIWVPTWTWHRVDYATSMGGGKKCQLTIGASLFHLRPLDFVRNNPLFAMLVMPNLFTEVIRRKTE